MDTSPSSSSNLDPAENRLGIWARKGLAWKFFAYTFPFICLVVLGTQIVLAWLNYQDRLATHLARTRLTASLTAEALSKSLWNMDSAVYKSQIRAISQDDNFVQATLWDEKGKELFRLDRKDTENGDVKVTRQIKDPGNKDASIGKFQLVVSTKSLRNQALNQAAMGVVAIGILLAGFFITLHLAVRGLIKKPLDRLLSAMGMVEQKKWRKVDWESEDEIGLVTGAFNRMVDGLKSGDEAKRLLAELEKVQKALVDKNKQLKKANRLIIESIQYARRIQTAMLPDKNALGDGVKELHVCWEPLHLVGGDYFWLERFGDKCLLVVIDCTGHGVPGAFMTLVVASALDNILHEDKILTPSAILYELDRRVRARLRQDQPDSDSDDGLEAVICLWDPEAKTVTFAGAGLPLMYTQDGKVTKLKGDRGMLGYRTLPPKGGFRDRVINVEPGMSFYMLTDGISDHMGGEPPMLLGKKRLCRMIDPIQDLPMSSQLECIEKGLRNYRGEQPRRDDMTLVGFTPL